MSDVCRYFPPFTKFPFKILKPTVEEELVPAYSAVWWKSPPGCWVSALAHKGLTPLHGNTGFPAGQDISGTGVIFNADTPSTPKGYKILLYLYVITTKITTTDN